jgi:hypothetical protein
MRLHVRIVNLEELASPLIGPPVMWEGDLDYDGPADDAAIASGSFSGWTATPATRASGWTRSGTTTRQPCRSAT